MVFPSLLGAEQDFLPPVQWGPLVRLTGRVCGVRGMLMFLDGVRAGWVPQCHGGQTDSSLPRYLSVLEGLRVQKTSKRGGLGQGRAAGRGPAGNGVVGIPGMCEAVVWLCKLASG